jgi:hypothetical protein
MFHIDIVESLFTYPNISTFGVLKNLCTFAVPKNLDIVIFILTTWASIPHPKVHQLSDCTQKPHVHLLGPRTCYHARACPCPRKFASK